MEVSLSAIINAPADSVWGDISDFRGIDRYLPIVSRSEMEGSGVGALRTLTIDGNSVVERLESLDEGSKTLSYSIVDAPLPISGYLSTMRVRDAGDGRCELTWSAVFEPEGITEDAARETIEGVYNAGFEGLRQLHGG